MASRSPWACLLGLIVVVAAEKGWKTGRVTHYGENSSGQTDGFSIHDGSCEFGSLDPNIGTGWDIGAISDSHPDYRGSCGCCGDMDHFDISVFAFQKLAPRDVGVIAMDYREIPCPSYEAFLPAYPTKIFVDNLPTSRLSESSTVPRLSRNSTLDTILTRFEGDLIVHSTWRDENIGVAIEIPIISEYNSTTYVTEETSTTSSKKTGSNVAENEAPMVEIEPLAMVTRTPAVKPVPQSISPPEIGETPVQEPVEEPNAAEEITQEPEKSPKKAVKRPRGKTNGTESDSPQTTGEEVERVTMESPVMSEESTTSATSEASTASSGKNVTVNTTQKKRVKPVPMVASTLVVRPVLQSMRGQVIETAPVDELVEEPNPGIETVQEPEKPEKPEKKAVEHPPGKPEPRRGGRPQSMGQVPAGQWRGQRTGRITSPGQRTRSSFAQDLPSSRSRRSSTISSAVTATRVDLDEESNATSGIWGRAPIAPRTGFITRRRAAAGFTFASGSGSSLAVSKTG